MPAFENDLFHEEPRHRQVDRADDDEPARFLAVKRAQVLDLLRLVRLENERDELGFLGGELFLLFFLAQVRIDADVVLAFVFAEIEDFEGAIGLVLRLAFALALAACGGKPPTAPQGSEATAQDAGYIAAPRVDAVRADGGGVVLSGAAPAGGKVRLATPAGQAMFAVADSRGRWAIPLPAAPEPRIFGLSVTAGGRRSGKEQP